MAVVDALLNTTLSAAIRVQVGAKVNGLENLPQRGPAIVLPGPHACESESLAVAAYMSQLRPAFYAKAEYWGRAGFQGALLRRLMEVSGNVPVNRRDPNQADAAINAGVALLLQERALAVYPEGTRTLDTEVKNVYAAYPGFAHTLMRASYLLFLATGVWPNIPIIPVGLIGMRATMPARGGLWPAWCRGKTAINIGAPIYLGVAERETIMTRGHLRDGKVVILGQNRIAQQLGETAMRAVAELSGYTYVPRRLEIPRG